MPEPRFFDPKTERGFFGVRRPDRGLDRAVDCGDSRLVRFPVAGFGAELKGRFETEGPKHRRPIDWSLQFHAITK